MSTRLGGSLITNPAEVRTSSATQQAPLGAYIESIDGRGFRYVQNGATVMVFGNVYQSSAESTNHQNLVPAAAAAGDTEIAVTLGATAAGLDEYAGGLAIVTANSGEGECYTIVGHAVVASSGTLTATLASPIKRAIKTSSTIDLVRNPYKSVVVAPTTVTGAVVGVALHDIGASEYGWVQTHGPTAVRAGVALVVGLTVVRSTGTAGAVEPATGETGDVAANKLGYVLTGVATSEFGAVYLTID